MGLQDPFTYPRLGQNFFLEEAAALDGATRSATQAGPEYSGTNVQVVVSMSPTWSRSMVNASSCSQKGP